MKRAGRFLVGLTLVAVLVLALAWAARAYLTSRHAADKVAARLSDLYGGPLQLDAVDIGMDGSSVRGLRLLETGDEEAEPWLRVEKVQADLGAWDLLGENPAPAHLNLEGASLTLRFDSAGHLLTKIPPRPTPKEQALPSLHVMNGAVTLRQEGRPEMVVQGVDAQLAVQEGQLALRGTVADPNWGEWTLSGRIDPLTGSGETLLATEHADATMPKLRSIPFVSTKVWEQVQVEGKTPVRFTLRFDPAVGSWKYRVELHPENTSVFVKSIFLQSEQVRGDVTVEDGLVTLHDLQGQTADGAIRTSADLDFRQPLRQMRFEIGVNRLDIHRLPRNWKLPVLLGGRLTGQAELKVTVGGEPRVLTTGEGKGTINGTIPVRLLANATGFHFSL